MVEEQTGGSAGLETSSPVVLDPTDQTGSQFGHSVSGAGDVDGDGKGDVLVGAPVKTSSSSYEGMAYLWVANVAPTASATGPTGTEVGTTITLDGTGSSDSDGTITSYSWVTTQDPSGGSDTFTDANTATPELTPSASGTYTFELTVTDDDGATATDTHSVDVNAYPTASFTYSPSAPNTGETVILDGTGSSDADGSISSWEWTVTDPSSNPSTLTGSTPSFTVDEAGIWTVELTVTDDDGAPETTTQTINTNTPPTASAGGPSGTRVGATITLDGSGSSDGNGPIASYSWTVTTNPGGDTLADPKTVTPEITPSASGTYTFELTVTDDHGAIDTDTVSVDVNAPPTPRVTGPTAVTVGTTITLDGTGSWDGDGSISSYSWGLSRDPSGGTDTLTSPHSSTTDITVNAGGTYRFRLVVVDDEGAAASATLEVEVNVEPTADFSYSPNVPNDGEVVDLDGQKSSDSDGVISSYDWSVTDPAGNTSSERGRGPSIRADRPGDWTVELTVTDDDGATDTTSKTVRVNAPPTAQVSASPSTPNEGETIQLDASGSSDGDGTISAYDWTIYSPTGNRTLGSGQTTSLRAKSAGTWRVHLEVIDDDGASATANRTIEVNARPSARVTIQPTEPTLGDQLQVDGSGSRDPDGRIAAYVWQITDPSGNTSTDSATTVSVQADEAGAWQVALTVTDGEGAAATATETVEVNAPPEPKFAVSPSTPNRRERVNLDATGSTDADGTIASYRWRIADPDGRTKQMSGDVPSFRADEVGDWTVELTVTDDVGASGATSRTVMVNGAPTAEIAYQPQMPAVGETVQLDGSGSFDAVGQIASYEWRVANPTGETHTKTGEAPSFQADVAGRWLVELTVTDDNGMTAEASEVIDIEEANRPPTATFTAEPEAPAVGETVELDASESSDPDGAIEDHAWTITAPDGSTRSAVGWQAQFAPEAPGEWTVELTVTDGEGASDSVSSTITVGAGPEATLSSPEVVDVGEAVDLDASGSSDPDDEISELSFDWTFADAPTEAEVSLEDVEGPQTSITPQVPGTYNVELVVTDPDRLSDTVTGTVRVNGAPEFVEPTPTEPVGALASSVVTFEVAAEDPDGDDVEISATAKPEEATFEDGEFRWDPASGRTEGATVVVEATDGRLTTSREIEIRLTEREREDVQRASSGCGCRAGEPTPPADSMIWLVVGVLGLGALRRRRRAEG